VSIRRVDALVHELRSPVAALAGIAAAARSGWVELDAAARARLLELAVAAGRDVERLLDDPSVASVRLATLDAGHVAAEAVESAALAGMRVRAEIEDGLVPVRGDVQRLRQLLDNLVENGVGHSPPDAWVVVAARPCDEGVELSVSDEGEGIPPDQLERIFRPGVRLTDARPGAGLGLTIAKEIADAHGAALTVTSRPGRGSTFRLVLPPAGAGPA
jgi:signal transduction histidine kinase